MKTHKDLYDKMFETIEHNSYDDVGKCKEENISSTNKAGASYECADVSVFFAIDVLNDLRQRFIDDRIGHVYILDKKIEELQSLLK